MNIYVTWYDYKLEFGLLEQSICDFHDFILLDCLI
jgi:hypothetical protein